MVKHFYSYIIETETVFLEIDSLSISDSEKNHLKSLAESHIHSTVLDTILSELHPEDKKEFVTHLNTKDHDRIWKFLHIKVEDAENKIKIAAHAIKKELLNDIKQAREKN